jgi:hypothetical protein
MKGLNKFFPIDGSVFIHQQTDVVADMYRLSAGSIHILANCGILCVVVTERSRSTVTRSSPFRVLFLCCCLYFIISDL